MQTIAIFMATALILGAATTGNVALCGVAVAVLLAFSDPKD
tara:strand:- start:81 stop:203 length:123 start_codon:yes stop_codon:yes gene_type:complete